MRAAGFTEERGVHASHLKLYADFVSLLAREEIKLFADTTGRTLDTQTAAQLAEIGVETVNEMIALMRKAAILRQLAELNVPIGSRPAAGAAASDHE
jgi:hypothetical protein